MVGKAATDTQLPFVLLVDDDESMRAYMRDCLGSLSVRVIEAPDGLEALEVLRSDVRDGHVVVVADVHMPNMDGHALRDALRSNAQRARVPVLLVTGDAIRTRDGPALRKPFNATTLKNAVLRLLGDPSYHPVRQS